MKKIEILSLDEEENNLLTPKHLKTINRRKASNNRKIIKMRHV